MNNKHGQNVLRMLTYIIGTIFLSKLYRYCGKYSLVWFVANGAV